MKIKNPIRTYYNWAGNEMIAIANAPALQAIARWGKLNLKVIGISLATGAVVGGVTYGVCKLREKLEDRDS